jgi:hypothetical protein
MLALVLAATLSTASLTPADAPTAAPAGASLTERDDSHARLIFLSERLQAGQTAARAWYWTWTAVYLGGSIAQGIAFFLSTDLEGQVNWAVGTATTLLGLLLMLVTDFPAEYATRELARMAEGTPEQRRAKLKRAEELLEGAATAESDGRAWYIHLGGAAVSLAGGLILWLAYGFLVDGIINAAVGIVVTEVQIWTQPTRAIKDWAEYQAQFGGRAATSKPSVRFVPTLGGLALAGRF